MEALTDDIERISVKDNNMVEIQTNTQLYTYHIDVIDSITFHDVEEGMLPGIFSVAENKTVCSLIAGFRTDGIAAAFQIRNLVHRISPCQEQMAFR